MRDSQKSTAANCIVRALKQDCIVDTVHECAVFNRAIRVPDQKISASLASDDIEMSNAAIEDEIRYVRMLRMNDPGPPIPLRSTALTLMRVIA
jgi:hypothetical protein